MIDITLIFIQYRYEGVIDKSGLVITKVHSDPEYQNYVRKGKVLQNRNHRKPLLFSCFNALPN